ncbi:MAG: N-acetyl-gamma-glutamyl-phosphate reductase [Candidatus Altarchaeaceae archaeon]
MKISVSVIGASGYTGIELMRLLVNHNKVEKIIPYSRTYKGKNISDVDKFLLKFNDKFEKFKDYNEEVNSDVCFLCMPNGEAMKISKNLLKNNIKVIDLSADFRLPLEIYENVYKIKHISPELIDIAVYGLPEIFREKIRNANLIANPGCYATSAILGLYPLKDNESEIFTDKIVVDAKSGTSGAGKKVEEYYLHSEIYNNLKPYNVTEHRHRPEIENVLKNFINLKISFTPTLLPISRGIITNIHIFCKENFDFEKFKENFKNIYKNEKFINVVDLVELKSVLYTNFCNISLHYDKHTNRLLIISAIDNLIKGAAGQAIQNMNIMFNFDEDEGLKMIGGV